MPLALLLGCTLYVLYGLLINYNAARKTGLPLVNLPFDCGLDHRQEGRAVGQPHTFWLYDFYQVQLARMGDLGPL